MGFPDRCQVRQDQHKKVMPRTVRSWVSGMGMGNLELVTRSLQFTTAWDYDLRKLQVHVWSTVK